MSADASAAMAVFAQPAELTPGMADPKAAAAQFGDAMQAAQSGGLQGVQSATPTGGMDAIQPAVKGMLNQIESVNGEASQLAQAANQMKAKGGDMSPGDMVMLTVRCQEFMFHCQLTSNIANRTSDGLQQLFRQQG